MWRWRYPLLCCICRGELSLPTVKLHLSWGAVVTHCYAVFVVGSCRYLLLSCICRGELSLPTGKQYLSWGAVVSYYDVIFVELLCSCFISESF